MRRVLLAALALLCATVAPPAFAQLTPGFVASVLGSPARKAFTTLDPAFATSCAAAGTTGCLTGGNLTFTTANGTQGARSIATIPTSGCTHIEVTSNATFGGTVGFATAAHPVTGGSSWIGSGVGDSLGINHNSNQIWNGSTKGNLAPSFTLLSGQVLAIEINTTTGAVGFNYNNTGWTTTPSGGMRWDGSLVPGGGGLTFPTLTGALYFGLEIDANNASGYTVNFGASSWAIAPNAGCVGLS